MAMADRIEKQTVLVTGATGAIGKAIAAAIASQDGYQVVLLCRNAQKAAAAVSEIRRTTNNPDVRFEAVDVSRHDSIKGLAQRLQDPVHVLINNAAITPRRREETPEGIELQFATNVLGYFWMIQALQEHLTNARSARVVNVASYWAGGLDLNDPEYQRRHYDNGSAYRQSKQADRMLSAEFARRLDGKGIRVNACHPGDVNSNLSNQLGFGGHESPEQGARTPVWLATGDTGGKETGKYFEHLREVPCEFSSDRVATNKLYDICASYDSLR